jgi:hypothetical protein
MRFDGKKQVMISDNPKVRWREALNTIEALRPSMVELLDNEARVLRVTNISAADYKRNGLDGEEDEEDERTVQLDPNDRDVKLAQLILEATDRGAVRHAEAYTFAFGKVTEFMQVLADRLTGLEGAWQDTLTQLAEAKGNAGGSDDGADMVGNVVKLAVEKQIENAMVKNGHTKGTTKGKSANGKAEA